MSTGGSLFPSAEASVITQNIIRILNDGFGLRAEGGPGAAAEGSETGRSILHRSPGHRAECVSDSRLANQYPARLFVLVAE
jgi:hypothetical protein